MSLPLQKTDEQPRGFWKGKLVSRAFLPSGSRKRIDQQSEKVGVLGTATDAGGPVTAQPPWGQSHFTEEGTKRGYRVTEQQGRKRASLGAGVCARLPSACCAAPWCDGGLWGRCWLRSRLPSFQSLLITHMFTYTCTHTNTLTPPYCTHMPSLTLMPTPVNIYSDTLV